MAKRVGGKNLNRIVILNIIGTVSYQAINFLLTPILTRALGGYDFGVITLYSSWVNILLPILSLNLESVIALIAVYIDQKEKNRYITSLAGLMLISFACVSGLIFLFFDPVCRFLQFEPMVVIMLLVHCFGQMFVHFMIIYYVQNQRPVLQFSFSITISVATFLMTILLLKVISNPAAKYLCRIVGFALPYFIGGIVALCLLLRMKTKWFCVDVWKYALPICVPFIFHTLSHLVLSQSGKIILQNFAENGVDLAGYYGFAFTIASIMQVIWTALNNAWIPYYYRLLANDDLQQVKISSNRYMVLYTGGFAAFALISPEMTAIMGGSNYASASKLVLVMLLGIYLVYLYSFAVNYKTFQKRTVSIAVGTITAAVANILGCLLLVPRFGYWGCAGALLIAYFILLTMHHLTAKDTTGKYCHGFSFYFQGILCAALACAATWLMPDQIVLRWILAVCIGVALLVKMIRQKSIF